ncbi:MAG: glycosyltransferase [Candidatus Riflebacteria bacterium]|nr:glycosyltransferase [Candidatus Riflebacteria bacterium]
MRIIHSLEGHSWSGGQQQALFLTQGQIRLGHDVLLLCQKNSELERRARALNIPVAPQQYRGELNPVSIAGLMNVFRSFRPDVVNVHRAWAHTQWLVASLIMRFRGLIVTRRVLFRPDRNPLSLVKYRTPAVRGFIAVSKAVSARLVEQGVPSRRIQVVHSATDFDRFDPARAEQPVSPLPVPDDAPLLLLIGNFHRNKGHFLVLEAFERVAAAVTNVHLLIAGHGTDRPELSAKAGALAHGRERLHLLGFRTDAPALMARSCLTINASFEEGFSGTIRESLGMGVPVIASAIPANLEISEAVPIRLFQPGSAEGLAEGIRAELGLTSDASRRETLRSLAMVRFGVPGMVNATIEAHHRLGIKS